MLAAYGPLIIGAVLIFIPTGIYVKWIKFIFTTTKTMSALIVFFRVVGVLLVIYGIRTLIFTPIFVPGQI
jgi:hypothetical protein